MVGLLDEAAEHGDRWLAVARAEGDVTHEARALSSRMRSPSTSATSPGMAALHRRPHRAPSTSCPPTRTGPCAMTCVAQSYMLLDHVAATCEWADKALALADANGFDRVRLGRHGREGLGARARARQLPRQGAALLRRSPTRPSGRATTCWPPGPSRTLVWHARVSSRFDEARELVDRMRTPRRDGRLRLAGQLRAGRGAASLAAADGDLDAAIAVLDEQRPIDPAQRLGRQPPLAGRAARRAGPRGRRPRRCRRLTEEAKPATPRSRVGVLGLDAAPRRPPADLDQARAILPELAPALAARGLRGPVADPRHRRRRPRRRARPDELRPLRRPGRDLPGPPLRPAHPLAPAPRRPARRGRRRHRRAALAGYAAPPPSPPTWPPACSAASRGTAHVGAARSLSPSAPSTTARAHADAAAALLARWRGWRVDELQAVAAPARHRRRASAGPTASRRASGRWPPSSPRGSPTPGSAERLYISPRTAAVHVSNIL